MVCGYCGYVLFLWIRLCSFRLWTSHLSGGTGIFRFFQTLSSDKSKINHSKSYSNQQITSSKNKEFTPFFSRAQSDLGSRGLSMQLNSNDKSASGVHVVRTNELTKITADHSFTLQQKLVGHLSAVRWRRQLVELLQKAFGKGCTKCRPVFLQLGCLEFACSRLANRNPGWRIFNKSPAVERGNERMEIQNQEARGLGAFSAEQAL